MLTCFWYNIYIIDTSISDTDQVTGENLMTDLLVYIISRAPWLIPLGVIIYALSRMG